MTRHRRSSAGGAENHRGSSDEELRARISAYVDRELSPEDAATLEREAATDPAVARLVESYRTLGGSLADWARADSGERSDGSPGVPSSFRDPSRSPGRVTAATVRARFARRRRRVLVLRAAAVFLVGATILVFAPFVDRRNAVEEEWVIRNLDVLETLERETGGDLSPELVDLLLEETTANAPVLGTEIFDWVLEEEIAEENL